MGGAPATLPAHLGTFVLHARSAETDGDKAPGRSGRDARELCAWHDIIARAAPAPIISICQRGAAGAQGQPTFWPTTESRLRHLYRTSCVCVYVCLSVDRCVSGSGMVDTLSSGPEAAPWSCLHTVLAVCTVRQMVDSGAMSRTAAGWHRRGTARTQGGPGASNHREPTPPRHSICQHSEHVLSYHDTANKPSDQHTALLVLS